MKDIIFYICPSLIFLFGGIMMIYCAIYFENKSPTAVILARFGTIIIGIMCLLISFCFWLSYKKRRNSIEIFVKEIRLDDFVLWFTEKYGPMEKRISDQDFVVYHIAGNKRPFSVILTYQIEEGPFTSITINPNLTTWNNDVEFAREFHRMFGCSVRCDPGSSAPQIPSYSDYFLEIKYSKEDYICWGDELIEKEKVKDK